MTNEECRKEALRWAVTAAKLGEPPEDTVRRAEAYYQYLVAQPIEGRVVQFPAPVAER